MECDVEHALVEIELGGSKVIEEKIFTVLENYHSSPQERF